MREIVKPPNAKVRRVFVLPSQLNGAEYPSQNDIVETVSDYYDDNTGGPRGQLAGDLGIASFIIDNAANENSRNAGINNLRYVLPIPGLQLLNGYLINDASLGEQGLAEFERKMDRMTIVGVEKVAAVGLRPSKHELSQWTNHTVDLIYASAVPLAKDYNQAVNDFTRQIAFATLCAQYTGSLRFAVDIASRPEYSNYTIEVNCMPLGGGVFKNNPKDIAQALKIAHRAVDPPPNVRVRLLAWDAKDHDENPLRLDPELPEYAKFFK